MDTQFETVPGRSNVWALDIRGSSLIRKVEWEEGPNILTVYFRKYYTDKLSYEGVSKNHFIEFAHQKSIGKYYLHYIKQNFTQLKECTMSEKRQRKTKNVASNKKRFIDFSLDVRKINKDWLFEGEKGTYLNVRLIMLPDGEVDKHGNLGFVVQSVPTPIYKAAEAAEKGSGRKIQGNILGNAAELDWENQGESIAGEEVGVLGEAPVDDFPF